MGLTFKLGTAPQVTTNYIPKSNSNSFSNSLIFDNGTAIAIGNGLSSATPQLGLIEATDGSGTNIAGAELRLQGGQGTGTGAGGALTFYTSAAGSSGSSTNSALERMRITTAGLVGIGTASPSQSLEVNVTSQDDGVRITSSSSKPTLRFYSSAANSSNRNWAISPNGQNFGDLQICTSAAQNGDPTAADRLTRLIITNTGNVGIGTSSPSQTLHIKAPSGSTTGLRLESSGGTTNFDILSSEGDGNVYLYQRSNYGILIGTNNTERMRITSGGILLVGGITSTSAYLDGYISVSVPSGTAPAACFKNLESAQFVSSFWNAATTGDNIFVRFVSDSGASIRGTIFYSRANGVTRFDGQASGTYSDERLKDIKAEMGYGLDTINKIKTYDFIWKRNGNKGFGVKAQEICQLIPEIVEKGSDGEIDPMEFQTTDIWKVNYNELVPVLIKAIQELSAKVSALENKA